MAGKAKPRPKAKPKETVVAEKPVCFVISPIGEPKSETALRADQTIRHLIEPAAEGQGFAVLRADKEQRPGIITTHIIQRLVDSPLVIADLTESNPNVFYELAIRHVTRKPLLHIVTSGQRIPFDVQMMRAVKYDLGDPDVLAEAREELEAQIEAVKDEDDVETPISAALELKKALESDDPGQVALAEIKREMQSLRAEVRNQGQTISLPTSVIGSGRIGSPASSLLPVGAFEFDPDKLVTADHHDPFNLSGAGGSGSKIDAVSDDD